jgi:hypothetical protein
MEPIYANVILWAVLLFLSYIGYGAAIVRLLKLAEFNDFGWAAKAAVGMSASIVLGSVLMVFKAATPAGLTSVAVMGFGLACYFFYLELNKPPISTSNKSKGKSPVAKKVNYQWLFLVIPGAFALLTFATSVYWPFQYDPNDDWVAYLAFPEKILQTGTLIEPFSQRRIFSLCGQSVLLAQIMIVAEPESAHLLDRGFGAILLFGLLVEATRKTTPHWQWLRALFILAAVTVSVPRINTSSTVVGVCLIFAFFLCISKIQGCKVTGWKVWIIPALVLAGASSLRFTYALACAGALGVWFILMLIENFIGNWKNLLQNYFKTGLLTFLYLAPSMVVSWESSRTPIYPLMDGNLMPNVQFVKTGMGFFEDAKVVLSFFSMPEVATVILGMSLVFLLQSHTQKLAAAASGVGICLGILIAINTTGTAATWNMDFYRLVFPILAASFFWILAMCLDSINGKGFFWKKCMAFVALMVFFWPQAEATSQELQVQMEVLKLQEHGFKFQASPLQSYYKDLQNLVPAGEKIFAIVDAPYLLDYSRNPIFNVDNIACASPPPGMPFNKGAPALEEYLRNLGIKYLLAVDFNKAIFLYNRQVMENHPRSEFRDFSKNFIVDFFNNIDTLAQGNIIAKNANSRLIWIASE